MMAGIITTRDKHSREVKQRKASRHFRDAQGKGTQRMLGLGQSVAHIGW